MSDYYQPDISDLIRPSLAPGLDEMVNELLDPSPNPYAQDPVGWIKSTLGESLWSKQREIAESVRDNRYTAVQSCHGTGKSYIASRIVAWWLGTKPVGSAFAVTTAPTQRQIEAILWRYIRAAHRKGDLGGRTTLNSQWFMGNDELVAYGSKPKDYTNTEEAMQSFQGIHARYVLVVVDEACGIPKWLFDAVDTLVTNEDSRVLAIGNPDDPTSQFERVTRAGSGWNVIRIPYSQTPNFTDESVSEALVNELIDSTWVDERRARWGEQSNLYRAKVLGEFPEQSEDMLISSELLRRACDNNLGGENVEAGTFVGYGLDVARSGEDESACYSFCNGTIRSVFRLTQSEDTMNVAGRAAQILRGISKQWSVMNVDVIGIGSGVYDRLREQGWQVAAFNSASRSTQPHKFKNKRAEAYWRLRTMMEQDLIDLDSDDEDLLAQLSSIKWQVDSAGRIQIESKEKMSKRGVSSPDLADAVVMALDTCTKQAMPTVNSQVKTITGDLLTIDT